MTCTPPRVYFDTQLLERVFRESGANHHDGIQLPTPGCILDPNRFDLPEA